MLDFCEKWRSGRRDVVEIGILEGTVTGSKR